MCGICGFVGPDATAEDAVLLARMNAVLQYRGPDDDGAYLSGQGEISLPGGEADPTQRGPGPHAALAMRRLSIIDLEAGHQPITNEDGTCWIVYNGEVYNFAQLRAELEARGHRFKTRTDTEALLHAYEEYGPDCVHRFRGMFGLAIWDEGRQRLLLARDPTGIKPLYYVQVGERLVFASEIKSLLQYPGVRRELDEESLYHFLSYLYVPAPGTMFAGIRQLPPGHRLIWERGVVTVEEYWAGPEAWVDAQAQGEPSRPEQAWDILRESVEAHLVSDVPLGAFLSGGIDSCAIVAMMAELMDEPPRTYSIGFRGAGLYDESPHARAMAEHVGAEHTEFHIESETVEDLPRILRHLDEPLADASVIPNYHVARLARQEVTVALTGIGGDELFGGYQRYFGDALAQRWRRIPRLLRQGVLLPILRALPSGGETRFQNTVRLAEKFLAPLDQPPEDRYLAWNSFFDQDAKQALLADGARERRSSYDVFRPLFARAAHRPFADRAMYVDLKTYLPGDPLFLSDRLTMAHSLEARVPFLDVKVMDYAARLPLESKIRGRGTKLVLREALRGRIPESLLHRPKQGFGTPIDVWLKNELQSLPNQLLSREAVEARGLFRADAVQDLVERQRAGRRDFSQHLWALLMFELWCRAYLDHDYSAREDLTFADLDVRV